MAVSIRVMFFGATADIVGQRELRLDLSRSDSISSIFDRLLADYHLLSQHQLHFALNQQYATGKEMLQEDDELAIFTAVSGG